MQAAHSRPNNNQQAYTILRIKRKRTDEPLDALVVESRSRRKKSRGGGLDVFQFAQTLEADAWDDERARQDLQTQITKLAQDRHVSGTKQGSPIRETRHPGPSRTVEESNRRYTIRMAEEDARVSTCRRPTSP
ncbi:hypothetical protein ID866_2821 [Astraeus odoratus]|nr:hypothetical protein ID866_2821 [Astraeus odoratus]